MTVSDNKALGLAVLSKRVVQAIGEDGFDGEEDAAQWREEVESILAGLSIRKINALTDLFGGVLQVKCLKSFSPR